MTTPQPNVPLLRKVVEWVEAQAALPWRNREWRQDLWVTPPPHTISHLCTPDAGCSTCYLIRNRRRTRHCGTAYCLAGYIGHIDGVLLTEKMQTVNGDTIDVETDRTLDGEHVSAYAARRLGLVDATWNGTVYRHPLFDATNSARTIRRIAEQIAGEPL